MTDGTIQPDNRSGVSILSASQREQLEALLRRVPRTDPLYALIEAALPSGTFATSDVTVLQEALLKVGPVYRAEAAALLCAALNTSPEQCDRLTEALLDSLRRESVAWFLAAAGRAYARTAILVFAVATYAVFNAALFGARGTEPSLVALIFGAIVAAIMLPLIAVPAWPFMLLVSAALDSPMRVRIKSRISALLAMHSAQSAAIFARLTHPLVLSAAARLALAQSLLDVTEADAGTISAIDLRALVDAAGRLPRTEATAVVAAVGRVGNSQVVGALREICPERQSRNPAVQAFRSACHAAIAAIEDRQTRNKDRNTLLRTGDPENADATLLRSARGGANEPPEELLRSRDSGG